jgi:hypothetical protein
MAAACMRVGSKSRKPKCDDDAWSVRAPVLLVTLALLAPCSPFNTPQSSAGSPAARNPWTWSVDYSNNNQDLAVLVGDQIEVTLGSVGPGWKYDDPEISSSAIEVKSIRPPSPPNPGGPVHAYMLKAIAEGEARFRIHVTNAILFQDKIFELTIRVAAAASPHIRPGDVSTFDSTEPLLGTWVLNLAKSTFDPGHAPISETRTFKPAPEGIKAGIQITTGSFGYNGPSSLYELPSEKMTTNPRKDKVTRVGGREYRIEQLSSGEIVGSQTAVVSKNGMLLTIENARRSASVEPTHDVRVFDRQ